jgi:glycosyltransferase involved in cell wall biosynthesis
METGPLVVLEAFAAGVPVIGSALGGIADKVRHDVDGLLVDPFDSVEAWASTLSRCVDEPAVLERLRANVLVPRSMRDVARDMCVIYERLISCANVALA